MLDRALARTGRALDTLLAHAGSGQRGLPLFRARSTLLHAVACSPSIARVARDLPPGTVVTGAWMDRSAPEPLPDEVADFLDDGPAPIVITFGSMRGVPPLELRTAVDGLLEAGRRVVVQGPIAERPGSPSLLCIGTVEHRALFPRAKLVMHHGGAGTTHAVAAAGVPSVVVPHVGDQRYRADRLQRLGVAPAPVGLKNLAADNLAEATLAAAADPAMRDAARALATRVAAEDGIGATVALLERAAA